MSKVDQRCLDHGSWTSFNSSYFDVMIILFTISWFIQNHKDKFQPLYSVRIQTGITSWWRSMGTRRPSARWPWARSTLTSFHTRSNHDSIIIPHKVRLSSFYQVPSIKYGRMAVRITLISFHISHHVYHYQSRLAKIVSPRQEHWRMPRPICQPTSKCRLDLKGSC